MKGGTTKSTNRLWCSLTVPDSPPGFSVGLHTNTRERIDPVGSLAIAVEAMYLLTLLPWEGALRENFPVSAGQIAEEIYFEPTAAPDADEKMETQHMVLGLFVGCLSVSSQNHDLAYETTVTTKMRNEELGLVHIRKRTAASFTAANSLVNNSVTLVNRNDALLHIPASSSDSLTENSGTMADPDEVDFRINFRFIGAPYARNPRDIFLAALDALANAAPHESDDSVQRLAGTDARTRRNAVIMVESLARPDPRTRVLTYHYAARAVALIMRLMKLRNRFQAIRFELGYRGVRFGEGQVTRPRASISSGIERATVA